MKESQQEAMLYHIECDPTEAEILAAVKGGQEVTFMIKYDKLILFTTDNGEAYLQKHGLREVEFAFVNTKLKLGSDGNFIFNRATDTKPVPIDSDEIQKRETIFNMSLEKIKRWFALKGVEFNSKPDLKINS